MIALFTDFGLHGPYTGQMKAVVHVVKDNQPIVPLTSLGTACPPSRTHSAAAAAVRAESFNSELKGTSTMRAD